jgi:hypothetical protein
VKGVRSVRPSDVQAQIEAEEEVAAAGLDELPVPPWVGCLASVLVGLVAVVFVFQVGKLLAQGDLRWGGGSLTPTRLWLVQEGSNSGVGFSTAHVVDGSIDSPTVCVETRVRFLLLRSDGTAKPVTYCQCYRRSGDSWQGAGACPGAAEGGSS